METISFSEGPVPSGYSDKRYNSSPEGKARRTKYRRENSKWTTDATYLARPFIAWDGEGVTVDGQHLYVLLANSRGGYISNPAGLSTSEVLHFVASEGGKYQDAIHVIFGGGYDFNCWLADVPRASVDALYRTGNANVGSYRVAWMQGKHFRLHATIDSEETSITINDVVSFFQCSFVNACDSYLGDAFEDRDLIVRNKALRSSFTWRDVPVVMRYNRAELANLVCLMDELRLRLNRCNLRPRRWDGPGAIAASLLSRERIKDAKSVCPEGVAKASRHAFAGGRFELIRTGSVSRPAYEYDLNSAYPSALRHVPNLSAGTWEHLRMGQRPGDGFALYHISYRDGPENLPGPLFCRQSDGQLCWPQSVRGWYWGPEAALAFEYADQYGCEISCDESWSFVPDDPADLPFAFIEKLYAERQAMKAAGDGAHYGLKLALNSLYGKLCQQVGWKPAHGARPERIPPFHQLEWAGFTTSTARAAVMRAAMTNLPAVISFETDAIFTSEPLDVTIGPGLGDFERLDFDDLTYVQSGIYFGTSNGEAVEKTRGAAAGSLTKAQVMEGLAERLASQQIVTARQRRFVGAGVALNGERAWRRWRTWENVPIEIKLCVTVKREHAQCDYCDAKDGITLEVWHETYCPFLFTHQESCEFPIAWLNPNPAMFMLEELREEKREKEYY